MSMKKGTKVLALFLAIVTVFTGMSWDISRAKAEGESTAAGTLADGKITFDNIDVKKLEEAGFTSTRFSTTTGAAVSGEVDKSPSEHWFSGQSGYADGVSVTAKNSGIKPNTATKDDRYFLYTPYSYEDFKISTTIYYGAYAGVVFGEKNVYPTNDGTSGSVAVFFNSGRIHIMGAVDYSTAVITRGTKAAKSSNPNGTATGYAIFNNGAGDTIKWNAGTAYTLNVMKQGKHLTVWISGGAGVMTIDITKEYKTGWIGLQARGYHEDSGGFQSLEVKKINAVESQQLDNVLMSDLDDMGYTASVGKTLTKDSVADAFFSGKTNSAATITTENDGVKALAIGGSVSALNIPYVYENFRLEAEVYHGQLIGVAAGSATSYPRQAGMISVFYNITDEKVMLQMEGAFQSSTLKRVGGIAGPNSFQFYPTENSSKIDGAKEQTFTIVLEVRNKVMTVWMEGYDGYVTASVADTYKTDKISLIARKPVDDGGGFKSYTITNLDAGDAQNFDDVKLSNLDAASYTATKYSTGGTVTGSESKTTSSYWFSGTGGYAATTPEAEKNNGLKTKTSGGNFYTALNIPHVYKNFRLKTTVYKGQVLGVVIGKKNVSPATTASESSKKESITVLVNGKYLQIAGAVKYSTAAAANGASGTGLGSNVYSLVPQGSVTAVTGQELTIVVELQNGILSVWQEGQEGIVRLAVADYYDTENIALFQRQYDKLGDKYGGGLKSYEIEKLPATSNIGTTVDLGGYTSFDRVDVAELEEAGFTAALYDRTSGEKIIGADTKVSSYWFAGEVGKTGTKVAVTSNEGLKAKTTEEDGRMTVLNTPYTYEDFQISTEVYWGAYTGIVLGAEETFPIKETGSGIWIYFNANQIQINGAGIDPDSVVTTEGGSWNTNYAPNYIFKPHADFKPQENKGQVYKLNVEMKAGVLTVWVDGYSGMLSVKVSEAFEGGMIGLAARQYDSDGGGLKSLTVEELKGDIVKSYTSEEFAAYRQADGYTAPSYKNYFFAGWYTSERCALEDAVSADAVTIESGEVYAKFVPRYVLSTKAQISANLINGDLGDDAVGSIRFCTTVDTLQYSQVGFDISYMKGSTNVAKTFASNQVYKELNAIGDITYQPTLFCNISQYFKACTIKNIGEDYYDVEFTVTPFWKTLDGTVVKGDTVVKTVNQGRSLVTVSTVYVSDNGTDQAGYGTVARPYRTLNYAIDAVADGGTVCITDSCTIDNENAWEAHGKKVTIRGMQENAASVLYGAAELPRLCINDGAYFTNMTLKLLSTSANSVHAEGNPVTIAEDVVVEGVKEIYGGSRFSEVQSTDLKLYAGTYEKIFGGSYEKTVLGDTHVTVGGSVNQGIADTTKWSNHEHVYMLYGAGDKGSVAGDTYVTVEEGASFIYVYGGGRSAGSEVSGSTNVVFSGNAMSVYGGSYQGTNGDVSVKILEGTVQQVFGGCEDASMTGDVNISVLGGEVSRRIYGGCYNECVLSWKTKYSVTGCISVEIGGNANLSLKSTDPDKGINAVSRYESAIAGECGILIFNDGTYDANKNKIGSTSFSGNFQKYNYLVNAAAGGKVSVQSGKLKVVSNEGYTATVAVENGAALEPDEDGMYTLPELETTASRKTVTVTFAAAQ